MNRLIVCLTMVVTLSLVVESASAARGRRIRVNRVVHHAVRHNHVIHRAPVVHRHVTRVAPSRYLDRLQHSYRPVRAIPSYRNGFVHQFGHSGGITISGRVFSLHIGF